MRARLLIGALGALGACGGGGGSGSGSDTVPIVSTPTPTPAASPTPSPTPAPVYDIAFDLGRDRSFSLLGGELAYTLTRSSPQSASAVNGTLLDVGAVAFLNYTAASRVSTISQGNVSTETFDQPTFQRADQIVYDGGSRYLSFFRPGRELGGLPSDLAYTIGSVQYRSTITGSGATSDVIERRWIGGVPTLATDIPQSGAASYNTFANGVGIAPSDAGVFTLQRQSGDVVIDFSARTLTATIATTITTSGATSRPVTLTFTGRFVGDTSRLTGTVTGSDGGMGTWAGRIHGPAGVEFGLAYTYSQGSLRLIGVAEGARR